MTRAGVVSVMCLLFAGCGGDVDLGEDGEQSASYGTGSERSFQQALANVVRRKAYQMSSYADATNSGARALCIATWTVGGAAVGAGSSRACVAVGVVASETGVGAIAAAVCATSAATGLDVLTGGVLGNLTGMVVCPGGPFSQQDRSDIVIMSAPTTAATVPHTSTGVITTPYCQQLSNDYHHACGESYSCPTPNGVVQSGGMTCGGLLTYAQRAKDCADLRRRHKTECVLPGYPDPGDHEAVINNARTACNNCMNGIQAMVAAGRCPYSFLDLVFSCL